MFMPKDSSGDFLPPPEGTHHAICYRVIDLGTQQIDWQGTVKHQHKVMLSWELPDELMDDGRPFTISKRYTLSSSDKSNLRNDLESWRGEKFTDDEFGPGGFNIRDVLGVSCLLTIVHDKKGDKIYGDIAGIVKPPKGNVPKARVNEPVYFSLDTFDAAVFAALSDGLKAIISKSPEYGEAVGKGRPSGMSQEPPAERHDDGADDYGEAPF